MINRTYAGYRGTLRSGSIITTVPGICMRERLILTRR
jgi:hypothetical protein